MKALTQSLNLSMETTTQLCQPRFANARILHPAYELHYQDLLLLHRPKGNPKQEETKSDWDASQTRPTEQSF